MIYRKDFYLIYIDKMSTLNKLDENSDDHRSVEFRRNVGSSVTKVGAKTLRCWRDDRRIAEEFCEKYGLSYEECLYGREPYSVFFLDTDGDEICCCVSKNTEKSFEKGIVHEEDIVLYIPLNERDLTTDLHKKLLEFCTKNSIFLSEG